MSEKERALVLRSGIYDLASPESIEAFLRDKFGWVKEFLPGLIPNIAEFSSKEALGAFLMKLDREGMFSSQIDVLDAVKVFLLDVVSIRAANACGLQWTRIEIPNAGTVHEKQAQAVQRLSDALQKLVKVTNDIQSESLFSSRSRVETETRKGDPLQEALKNIENAAMEEQEDMIPFFCGATKPVAVSDDQTNAFEEELSRKLTPEEIRELNSVS